MDEFESETGAFSGTVTEEETEQGPAPQKRAPTSQELRAKQEKEDQERAKAREEKELKTLEELKKTSALKIKVEKFDDYVLITLANSLQYDTVKYFQFSMKYEVVQPYMELIENYIFNLKEVGMVDFAGMRELVQFQVTLKKRNKKMYLAEVSRV